MFPFFNGAMGWLLAAGGIGISAFLVDLFPDCKNPALSLAGLSAPMER
jgi:hypothetical protein